MTGYAAMMRETAQFSEMVDNLIDWVLANEEELTDGGESVDGLNDAFVAKLREECGRDEDAIETVRGEVAVKIDACGQYACTRAWAGEWA